MTAGLDLLKHMNPFRVLRLDYFGNKQIYETHQMIMNFELCDNNPVWTAKMHLFQKNQMDAKCLQ